MEFVVHENNESNLILKNLPAFSTPFKLFPTTLTIRKTSIHIIFQAFHIVFILFPIGLTIQNPKFLTECLLHGFCYDSYRGW